MKKKKFKYNKDELEKIVKNNLSVAGVCRDLGIRPVGGNYKTIKFYLSKYGIDISHFTGSAWNVGTRYKPINKPKTLSEILVENSTYVNTSNLKKRLIKEKYLEYMCVECGINQWNDKSITLHLDHINGINTDNRIENLRLLCPNCHSQTTTYCSKNNKSIRSEYRKNMYDKYKDTEYVDERKYCECGEIKSKRSKHCKKCNDELNTKRKTEKSIKYCRCGKKTQNRSKMCEECCKKIQRKVERPPYEQLKNEINETSYCAVGRKYGVSDNAIRKWIKFYEKNN